MAQWGVTMDQPRSQGGVPVPMHHGAAAAGRCASNTATANKADTIRALREKLSEFQAENSVLGALVKELKAERDGLHKRLGSTTKQQSEAAGKAAAASAQADALVQEQQRLKAEVERLTSMLHGHSLRLQKGKQHQQDLEDVALDLRAELDEVKAAHEAVQRTAAAATHRAAAAEAKLEAAGMGAMPKMGPTAEQLVINSTQRVKELSEELAAARADAEQQQADAQQQLSAVQQQLEGRLQQQEQQLRNKTARLAECEAKVLSLQQQLVAAQHTVVGAHELAETKQQLAQLRQGSQALEQQVAQLRGQLASCEAAHASALAEQQQRLATAQRERQGMADALGVVRQQESAARLAAGEAAAKAERLRGELLRCVGELQAQLATAAASGQAAQAQAQQLRALEATAAAARAEAAESRQQLVELATASLAELREQVAGEAAAISGLPEGLAAAELPAPIGSYIKVLEHAIIDCEQRSKQLLLDNLAAAQAEREARASLAAARDAAAAAERGLQQQTHRLLAAERMRLADLKEQQSLERRLALAHQECCTLRDALIDLQTGTGSRSSASSGQAGSLLAQLGRLGPEAAAPATAAAPASPRPDAGALGSSKAPSPPRAGELRSSSAAQHSASGSPVRSSQLAVSHQLQQQELWQVPAAADAGDAAGSDMAAESAATIKRYTEKLAELRRMREQLAARPLHSAADAHSSSGAGQQQLGSSSSIRLSEVPAAAPGSWGAGGASTLKQEQQQEQQQEQRYTANAGIAAGAPNRPALSTNDGLASRLAPSAAAAGGDGAAGCESSGNKQRLGTSGAPAGSLSAARASSAHGLRGAAAPAALAAAATAEAAAAFIGRQADGQRSARRLQRC